MKEEAEPKISRWGCGERRPAAAWQTLFLVTNPSRVPDSRARVCVFSYSVYGGTLKLIANIKFEQNLVMSQVVRVQNAEACLRSQYMNNIEKVLS